MTHDSHIRDESLQAIIALVLITKLKTTKRIYTNKYERYYGPRRNVMLASDTKHKSHACVLVLVAHMHATCALYQTLLLRLPSRTWRAASGRDVITSCPAATLAAYSMEGKNVVYY